MVFKVSWNIISWFYSSTAQKMKFSMKYFFSKCDQIRRKLRIWSHENFIFCAPWNKLRPNFTCILKISIFLQNSPSWFWDPKRKRESNTVNWETTVLKLKNTFKYTGGWFRSRRPEVFCKKCVLEHFAKFTEKHLCQNLLNKK